MWIGYNLEDLACIFIDMKDLSYNFVDSEDQPSLYTLETIHRQSSDQDPSFVQASWVSNS